MTTNKFLKDLIKSRKQANKIIKPRIYYDEEYGGFYMWFGGDRKVEGTVEVSSNMRFDIDKKGTILSVEIDDIDKYLKHKLE